MEDIGFKIQVTLDDALRVMQNWREFETAHVRFDSDNSFFFHVIQFGIAVNFSFLHQVIGY